MLMSIGMNIVVWSDPGHEKILLIVQFGRHLVVTGRKASIEAGSRELIHPMQIN
jgi:hypothetical protein